MHVNLIYFSAISGKFPDILWQMHIHGPTYEYSVPLTNQVMVEEFSDTKTRSANETEKIHDLYLSCNVSTRLLRDKIN